MFLDVATKPTKHKQTTIISTNRFEKQLCLKKKTAPGQTRNHDLCHPSCICYLQAKGAGETEKFEFIMNHTR